MVSKRGLLVHHFTRTVPPERGYIGETKERVQCLQVRLGRRFVTIDKEFVPDWTLVEIVALGESGWGSKFSSIGNWRSDGIITLK